MLAGTDPLEVLFFHRRGGVTVVLGWHGAFIAAVEAWRRREVARCLNNFSASISGASAGVRLPSGGAAVCSRLDRASCRQGSSVGRRPL